MQLGGHILEFTVDSEMCPPFCLVIWFLNEEPFFYISAIFLRAALFLRTSWKCLLLELAKVPSPGTCWRYHQSSYFPHARMDFHRLWILIFCSRFCWILSPSVPLCSPLCPCVPPISKSAFDAFTLKNVLPQSPNNPQKFWCPRSTHHRIRFNFHFTCHRLRKSLRYSSKSENFGNQLHLTNFLNF